VLYLRFMGKLRHFLDSLESAIREASIIIIGVGLLRFWHHAWDETEYFPGSREIVTGLVTLLSLTLHKYHAQKDKP